MISADSKFTNSINAQVREIQARVELYNGSTLQSTFSYKDKLKSFNIERIGEEGKFFGFGICQRLNVKLIDINREINITTENSLLVNFGTNNTYINISPIFYVSEVHRDEITNELSITAYDALYNAASHNVSEITLAVPYTIKQFAAKCGRLLGLNCYFTGETQTSFSTSYPEGANFEGTETIREALDAIAEATQTIYYINNENYLKFKRLSITGNTNLVINKDKYIDLDSKTNRRLKQVAHITDLGDNVAAENNTSGTIQYIRNNPFWELRDDIETLVNNADTAVSGLTINQFSCSWRGNYLLEIADKITLITKDDKQVISYVLNDTLEYNGALTQNTSWNYSGSDDETETNPSNLGDALKATYARVDKANKKITLLASETEDNKKAISSLEISTSNITSSVKSIEENTQKNIDDVNTTLAEMESKISQTADSVNITITERLNNLDNEINQIGYDFSTDGLTVNKAGTEMKTTITEDGMVVYKNDEAMLTANNTGVNAVNLHATTYLIIGNNSRFEDYTTTSGEKRTACFWIGG